MDLNRDTTVVSPEPVASLQEDNDAMARWQEASSLAGELSRDAIQKLLDLLGDNHPFVRWQAGTALAHTATRLRKRAGLGLPMWNKQAPELSFSGLLMLMRQGLLQDPNPERRAAIADALAFWDHEVVVTFLIQALGDEDPLVRASVATALGKIRDKSAVDALLAVLDDSSVWVRRAAIDALGAISDPKVVPALQQALADPHPLLRIGIISALGHLHTARAREILEQYARDQDASMRWHAVRGLGEIGSVSSLGVLQSLQNDPATFFGQSIAELASIATDRILKRERGLLNWLRRMFYALRHRLEQKSWS